MRTRAWRRGGAGVALAATAALLLAALLPAPALARKAYHADAYDVTLQVQPDGSLCVREEIRVTFDGGPFTFFYRGIPTTRTDGIDEIRPFPPELAKIRQRSQRRDITWTFPPCHDTTRTFAVEYLARGVLYEEDSSQRLRWVLFPSERAYRIDAASARIVFPSGTPAPHSYGTEPGGLAFREPRVWGEEAALEMEAVTLQENRSVIVQVDLPLQSLSAPEPSWRLQRLRQRERLPGALAVAAGLLALGLFWVWRTRSNALAKMASGTASARMGRALAAVSEPPEEISPALSGGLLYGQPSILHAFAVLLDLARRGALRIDPGKARARWSTPRPTVAPGEALSNLEPWERIVLDATRSRTNTEGNAEWRHVTAALNSRSRDFRRAVEEGLVQRGDFDPAGLEGRRVLQRRVLLLLIPDALAIAAGILLLNALGPAALLPVGAIALVIAAMAVSLATLPVRTRRGTEGAQAWKGFARYLREAAKGATPVDAGRFAAWLPHALALGAAPTWVKAAKRWGIDPPLWFRSASGDLTGDMRVLSSLVVLTSSSGGGSHAGAAGGGSSGAG